ncbi:MAG: winged helix DNA-binding domain-containing protein, partial [Actinobacteria bacterium]|nr:winged helix DNA-binding domain-containing protein [Actinomycetota bacterium]
MDAQDIVRRRMRAQGLWGRARFGSAEEVVGWLGAVQAQEYAYAKWSLGQRARGVSDADVEAAVADGRIIRTHVLRPTWHFVLPSDLRWMLGLTAGRVRQRMAVYDAELGLDSAVYRRAFRVIARALDGGDHLTRAELSDALGRGGVEATGRRLGHVMLGAELSAVACSGAPRGKQQTYTAFDSRVPPSALGGDEALAELVGRYLTSHGPATVKDFVWWSGLLTGDVRLGISMLGDELERVEVDGREYWFAPGTAGRAPARGRVDLVQAYDETIVGYTQSRDVVNPAAGERNPAVRPLLHAFLVDGRVAGTWTARVQSDRAVIAVQSDGPVGGPLRTALE